MPCTSISAYRGRTWCTNGTRGSGSDTARASGVAAQDCGVGGDDRVDRGCAQAGDVAVGERAVGRAEAQREREAPLANPKALGAELVEALDRLEQLATCPSKRVLDRRGRHRRVDHEREVDRRRGEARDGTGGGIASLPGREGVDVDLERDDGRVQAEP